MSTLDRYIARQYLFNVVALLVLLFAFVVAVDITLNIDRFADRARDLSHDHPENDTSLRRAILTVILVFNLWGPKLLQLFTYTVGLALVGAMGFTLTQMVRHRELTAMLASGISLRRIAWPILAVALTFVGLRFIDHEFILSNPRIAPLLIRDHGDAGNPNLSDFDVKPTAEGKDPITKTSRVYAAARFEPATQTMTNVDIWERDSNGIATRHIHASSAVWREEPAADGRLVGGWDLSNPKVQSLHMSPAGSTVAEVDPGPTPTRLITDLGPRELVFRRYATFSQSLSWRQISQMLTSSSTEPNLRSKLERIRWGRLSTMICTILSMIITMPFFLLREPKNMLVQSLKCAPVGIAALLGSVILVAVPVPGLPIWMGAMLPVGVLIPLAIASVGSVRT